MPAGKAIKRRPAWVTLTCVGLKIVGMPCRIFKEGARWRVCGCDRGARLAAIAPVPVGKMVNRVNTGDVDAQWLWRASNPHPPDRCGRSAMLSYGTMPRPYGAPDGGPRAWAGTVGWASCDAGPIRSTGLCRRTPSRPSKSPWRTRGLFGLAACLLSFQPGSNRRPSASEADALSTELWNVGGFSTRTYYASPSGASVGLAGLEPATSRPPAGRATDCATIRRAFLPTGGDGTPLREPCDRRTCPA